MHTILYLNATGHISGAERSLLAMLAALDRARFTPVVAAPNGPLLREAQAAGARVVPVTLSVLRRPAGWGEYRETLATLQAGWGEVRRIVAQLHPHVIHANSAPAMCYAYGVPRLPVIWHARDVAPLGHAGTLLYRRAARVAVISSAVRNEITHYGSGRKCVLLPPAVDTARFRPAENRTAVRAIFGLPPDVPLIGMVAQFVPWKRHHLFLDALEQIVHRPWHAVLAGADLHHDDDYFTGIYRRLMAPPLAGRVSWLPWQDDAVPLMQSLDLCVLTSDHEPFGRVLIEAMACGAAVLAMDDPGPRDIVQSGETGLLCAPTPGAIARAIAHLLADPIQRTRLARAARRTVIERFSVEHQQAALTELYSQLIEKR